MFDSNYWLGYCIKWCGIHITMSQVLSKNLTWSDMNMINYQDVQPVSTFPISLGAAQKLGFFLAITATALYMLIDVKRMPIKSFFLTGVLAVVLGIGMSMFLVTSIISSNLIL